MSNELTDGLSGDFFWLRRIIITKKENNGDVASSSGKEKLNFALYRLFA
jgi:hypothetical protein